MDFESFRKAGVSLGSGALLICDENTCVVDSGEGAGELLPQRKLRQVHAVPHRYATRLSPADPIAEGPGR